MPRPHGPVRPAEPSSTAQLQATLKDRCTAEWVSILKSCVASSKLAQALEASQHPQILVEASLRKFSGGTLSQYLRAIRLFLTFVHQCVGDLLSLTLAHLSDFIAGCHVSQAEDRTALKCSAIMMSKALSWFARIGQISSLLDLMGSPLIKSFAYNPKPHDRREALPLPLAILAAWEEHIVSPTCTPAVGLLLGALLLCAHCSLRFGDIQRIKPSALSLSAQALRGLCWATKTTCQGQPFACLPFGFRGEDISTSWLVKWLALLSQALDATHAEWGDSFVPDFILPCIPNLESHVCPSLSRPMSYLQALVCLRWAIQLPWKSEGGQLVTQHEASSFTLHSLKCALLSAAAQLKTAEGFRDTIASRPHCCTAGTIP